MSINTLTLKSCPKCGEALSYTDTEAYCAYLSCMWNNEECSTPAQESQSESVAAPAEVGQGQGTHSLQDFSDWLALRLNQAQRGSYPNRLSGESDSSYKFRCDEAARALCLVQCLILGFKLEQGA